MLDRLTAPIVQAPLAGGASTPELATAVSGAGGLGFLAAGYKTAEAVAAEMDAMGDVTYGVNVFVPGDGPADTEIVHCYAQRLRVEGHEPGQARYEDDAWQDKARPAARAAARRGLVHVRLPREGTVAALREAGSEVWVTVTGPEEARLAQWAGATGLVAQGIEAGGHRASFADQGDLGLLALLALLGGPDSPLALVASGGIATAPTVAAVLAAGARAAQVGTAFMRCPEAGTAEVHRQALARARPDARDPRVYRQTRPRHRESLPARAPRRAGGLPGAAPPDRAGPCRRPRARRRRGAEPLGGPDP